MASLRYINGECCISGVNRTGAVTGPHGVCRKRSQGEWKHGDHTAVGYGEIRRRGGKETGDY